ncbi:MAG: O-antigen ligase family protein [Oscillospiraceae bacterium]|nr:O-antigen ligase family protein [Oscillospiraceae bacterium]
MRNKETDLEATKGQLKTALFSDRLEKILSVFLFVSVFLGGLFPYWCGMLSGAFLLFLLWMTIRKKGSLDILKSIPALSIYIAVAFYLLSVIWAVDKGMALLGFFKYLLIALFLCLSMQLESGREKLFKSAALAGVASVVVCLPLSFIPILGTFLKPDGRFSGPFMYANTYGLFLLVCIVILFTQKSTGKKDYIFGSILILGILMTGSRSLFVLLALTMIVLLFVNWRAVCVASLIGVAAAGLIFLGAPDMLLRASDVSFSSGEWLTRLAYYYDGIRLLPRKLFGMGHLGWWYIQPQIQTSVYDVRFIHCWPLQVALDIGVVPALLLMGSAVLLFFDKRVDFRGKLLLILICGHALIDFDLNFLPVAFLIVMLIPHSNKTAASLRVNYNKWQGTAALLAAGLSLWLGVASFLSYVGAQKAAVAMYPFYTEAMEAIELNESDPLQAEKWADRVLRSNSFVYEAYNVKAKALANKGDWINAVEMKRSFLSIYRLEGMEYDVYLQYIYAALQQAAADNDVDTCIWLANLGLEVPQMIESTQKELSPFAYQIKHQPTLVLSSQSQDFLIYLEDYQKRLQTVKEALAEEMN